MKLKSWKMKAVSVDEWRIKHRERVIKDLPKGEQFENKLIEKVLDYTGNSVAIMQRNRQIGIIPTKEYFKNPERYREIINKIDVCVWHGGEPKIGIECGLRKGYYFNSLTSPSCTCEFWDKHVSVPKKDLERYLSAHKKYPHVQHWVIIGVEEPNTFIAVELKTWESRSFDDYNKSLPDNAKQSVICLNDTRHFDTFEAWAKRADLPQIQREKM